MLDIPPWHEVLLRPPRYGYDTPRRPVHTSVLMRCAERYELIDFRDHA